MRRRLIIGALFTALVTLALVGFALRLPAGVRTVVRAVLPTGRRPHSGDPVPAIE
jgi:hypothetical protein